MTPETKFKIIVKKLQELDSQLTVNQLVLLSEIAANPGDTATSYASKTGVTRAALSLSKAALQDKKGLIREGVGSDNRSSSLYLTDKTKEALRGIYEIISR